MVTVPSVTSSSPATRRSAVVLPHPEEPSRTRSSPSATDRVRSSTAVGVAEALRHAVEADLGQGASFRGGRPRPRRSWRSVRRPYRGAAGRSRAGASAGRDLPAHRLGDLLAGRAQAVALGVASGHPFLAAQGPHRPSGSRCPRRRSGPTETKSPASPSWACSPRGRCGPSGRGRRRRDRAPAGPAPASCRWPAGSADGARVGHRPERSPLLRRSAWPRPRAGRPVPRRPRASVAGGPRPPSGPCTARESPTPPYG